MERPGQGGRRQSAPSAYHDAGFVPFVGFCREISASEHSESNSLPWYLRHGSLDKISHACYLVVGVGETRPKGDELLFVCRPPPNSEHVDIHKAILQFVPASGSFEVVWLAFHLHVLEIKTSGKLIVLLCIGGEGGTPAAGDPLLTGVPPSPLS